MKMNFNKEKLMSIVSKEKVDTLDKIKYRQKNRKMIRESQSIALKVLNRIDELNWTQKQLADSMEVSTEQITKIVSGKENLTLDIIIKIEESLNIPILLSYTQNY